MNHYTSHSLDCGMPVTLAWTTDVNKFFRVSTPSILVSLVIKCILEKPWACGIDYKPPYLDCCMRVYWYPCVYDSLSEAFREQVMSQNKDCIRRLAVKKLRVWLVCFFRLLHAGLLITLLATYDSLCVWAVTQAGDVISTRLHDEKLRSLPLIGSLFPVSFSYLHIFTVVSFFLSFFVSVFLCFSLCFFLSLFLSILLSFFVSFCLMFYWSC